MKKFKLVLWLIIFAVLGLFFYQNSTFFMTKPTLNFQLPFMKVLHVPELPNAVLFLAFLLFGLLISYIFNLFERFKSGKTIKGLNATIESNQQMISSLKNELAVLKRTGSESSGPTEGDKEEIEKNVSE